MKSASTSEAHHERIRATVADDLCAPAADPCVVAGDVSVDPGSTLDFGPRTLQLAAGALVSWTGDLHIIAGQCDFQGVVVAVSVRIIAFAIKIAVLSG